MSAVWGGRGGVWTAWPSFPPVVAASPARVTSSPMSGAERDEEEEEKEGGGERGREGEGEGEVEVGCHLSIAECEKASP